MTSTSSSIANVLEWTPFRSLDNSSRSALPLRVQWLPILALRCLSSDYISFDPPLLASPALKSWPPLHYIHADFPPPLLECLISVLPAFPSPFNHWEFCPDLLSVYAPLLNFIRSQRQLCHQQWSPAPQHLHVYFSKIPQGWSYYCPPLPHFFLFYLTRGYHVAQASLELAM